MSYFEAIRKPIGALKMYLHKILILTLIAACCIWIPGRSIAAELRGDPSNVAAGDQAVLKAILDEAGVAAADVTSTMRTVAKQAELMCKAAARDFAGTYRLYCQAGKNMLDKYDSSKSCADQPRAWFG